MTVFAADDGYELPMPTEPELAAFLEDAEMDPDTAPHWLRGGGRSLPDYDQLFEDVD